MLSVGVLAYVDKIDIGTNLMELTVVDPVWMGMGMYVKD